MQIETFQAWLNEKYSDLNVRVHYIELKIGRKMRKIPVFEETILSVIDLKGLLNSYITAKTKDTEFSDLSLGVRFIVVSPFTQTKIFIWPQQFLHEKVIGVLDSNLAKEYASSMADIPPPELNIFTGTFLANSPKIQTNMPKSTFDVMTKNQTDKFLSKFNLTNKDIEFYK